MELTGYFVYAGIDSYDQYGIQIVNIETDRDLRMVGEPEPLTVFGKKGLRNHLICDRYDDSILTYEVEFYREDGIPDSMRSEIERWLFHRGSFNKLYMREPGSCSGSSQFLQTDEDGVPLYLNCRFLAPVKIEDGNGLVGYRATMQTDAPFAWADETEQVFALTGGSASTSAVVDVVVNSDLPEYIWPKVTIWMGSTGGDITIANGTDDASRLTSFAGITASTQLVINNETNFISGQNYTKFSNKNFIRLVNGVNHISVIGDITSIKFAFRNRRYL